MIKYFSHGSHSTLLSVGTKRIGAITECGFVYCRAGEHEPPGSRGEATVAGGQAGKGRGRVGRRRQEETSADAGRQRGRGVHRGSGAAGDQEGIVQPEERQVARRKAHLTRGNARRRRGTDGSCRWNDVVSAGSDFVNVITHTHTHLRCMSKLSINVV